MKKVQISTTSRAPLLLIGTLVVLTVLALLSGPPSQRTASGGGAGSYAGAGAGTAAAAAAAAAGAGGQVEAKGIFKRSFAGLGCLGVYDKAKFARLDRVCEECYQLYREPDIHTACRQDCFRNSVFTRCVDALLLSNEQKKFDEMVDELYGK